MSSHNMCRVMQTWGANEIERANIKYSYSGESIGHERERGSQSYSMLTGWEREIPTNCGVERDLESKIILYTFQLHFPDMASIMWRKGKILVSFCMPQFLYTLQI